MKNSKQMIENGKYAIMFNIIFTLLLVVTNFFSVALINRKIHGVINKFEISIIKKSL
jgi:hypothetical protein